MSKAKTVGYADLLAGSKRATQFELAMSWLTVASSNDSTNLID